MERRGDNGDTDQNEPSIGATRITVTGGQVGSIGDNNNVYMLQPGRKMTWPIVIGAPPPVASAYQDREIPNPPSQLLMQSARDDGRLFNVVVNGGGGVGKSQFAARCLRDSRDDLRIWVPASSRASIVASYGTAAHRLDLVPDDIDSDAAARRFLEYLRETHHTWMVVLDDIVDPDHVEALWPPTTGRLLATSRRRDARMFTGGREGRTLSTFSDGEAEEYLKNRLEPHILEGSVPSLALDQASELADILGCLPLALAQAAGVIIDEALTCETYVQRFLEGRRTLDRLLPRDSHPDGYSSTIGSTARISLDSANLFSPKGVASRLAQLIAYLDSAGLPQEILNSESLRTFLGSHTPASEAGCTADSAGDELNDLDAGRTVSIEEANMAMRSLYRVSVIQHNPNSGPRSISMHGLVGRTIRENKDDETSAVLALAFAIVEIWPDIETDAEFATSLRDNSLALVDRYPYFSLEALGFPETFLRCARSFSAARQAQAGLAFLIDVFNHCTDFVDASSPVLFGLRSHIGTAVGETGDSEEAVSIFEALALDREAELGLNHPDSLRSRSNLAFWKRHLEGNSVLAEYEDILTRRTRTLGPLHRETLLALVQVADLSGQTVPGSTVVEKLENALKVVVDELGDSDKLALTAERIYYTRRLGEGDLDPVDGSTQLRQLVTRHIGTFGFDHSETAQAQRLLVNHLVFQRSSEALSDLDAYLGQIERFGKADEGYLSALISQSQLRAEIGEPGAALDTLEAAYRDHGDFISEEPNLAIAYHYALWVVLNESSRKDQAVLSLAEALRIQLVVDSEVADSHELLLTLANAYEELGNWTSARQTLEELLAFELPRDGENSKDALITRSSIANANRRSGDPETARDQLSKLLADMEIASHLVEASDLVATRSNYGSAMAECGDSGSVQFLEELVIEATSQLGSDSPVVRQIRENLRTARANFQIGP